MMKAVELPPVAGCWVVLAGQEDGGSPGQVVRVMEGAGGLSVTVLWLRTSTREVLHWNKLACGFRVDQAVWHVPAGRTLRGHGLGVVVRKRRLAGREQLLVDFPELGTREWLPWQRLHFAKDPVFRFRHADLGREGSAERFRLRVLSHALRYWNENTGALSRFDIDPLPHQIHLVHHILASGNLNWLIADDVGLGKTIEAGLLIAALRQRNIAKRVLLVVPAGLTRQWQEDMHLKFGMDDFRIYGSDFQISDSRMWRMYDRVIVSMDRAKLEDHQLRLLEAERWDLVIVDEAHRLTRRQFGLKLERSDRYRLAEALREHCQHMVLLTATPHQGRSDQFSALLELLRPELRQELRRLEEHPELLAEMVFRNRKSVVTDVDGNFVFYGQTSRMIAIDPNSELIELERQLASYLKQGYQASAHATGNKGRAIGFVMTVYRKLAASSIITLRHALQRRLLRLHGTLATQQSEDPEDERFAGEVEERHEADPDEFFAGEIARLKMLIEICDVACEQDPKIAAFMDRIVEPVLEANPDEHLLIFTEYRGTQDYLVEHLATRYGREKVHVVNGGMDVEQRREAIAAFETKGQFLVSTEAGGEGINLHRRCHILVNYDLPWNPMRLAQRIGRLYRYGQKKHVFAFNMQAQQSADDLILGHMYTRLEQVAADMASVDDAGSERLASEIVGELADLMDIGEILKNAASAGVKRTQEDIESALARARDAADMQRQLFAHAASYEQGDLDGTFEVGRDHLAAFVLGMVRALGGDVVSSRAYPGRVWRLGVPEILRGKATGLSAQVRITFERDSILDLPNVVRLDMDHPLIKVLTAMATHYEFEGLTAGALMSAKGTVMTAVLRWQDEAGRRLREELVAIAHDEDGGESKNPKAFMDWLLEPARDATPDMDRPALHARSQQVATTLDGWLAEGATKVLQPDSVEVLAAAVTEYVDGDWTT